MSTASNIADWIYSRKKQGMEPKIVPVTREEILDIRTDVLHNLPTKEWFKPAQIHGVEAWQTPYAPEIRHRTADLENFTFISEQTIDELSIITESRTDVVYGRMVQRLKVDLIQDTTQIDITLEWDHWAKVKKWLKLKPKTKTVRIDGKVLYPYLKVQLPNNRHNVRFYINETLS